MCAIASLPQLYVPNVMAFARQQRPLTTLEGGANSSVADEDVDALVNGELLAAGPAAYAPAVRQRARLVSPLKLLETVRVHCTARDSSRASDSCRVES